MRENLRVYSVTGSETRIGGEDEVSRIFDGEASLLSVRSERGECPKMFRRFPRTAVNGRRASPGIAETRSRGATRFARVRGHALGARRDREPAPTHSVFPDRFSRRVEKRVVFRKRRSNNAVLVAKMATVGADDSDRRAVNV